MSIIGKPFYYLFLGIGKFVGPVWFFILPVWCRKYARNVVYNRVMHQGTKHRLKRFWERSEINFEIRDVGAVEFWLVFWILYIWLDDDSVSDTFDDIHCRTFVYPDAGDTDRTGTIYAKLFGRWLDVPAEKDSKAFDDGDEIISRFKFVPALIWQLRNTTMNFKYYFGNY